MSARLLNETTNINLTNLNISKININNNSEIIQKENELEKEEQQLSTNVDKYDLVKENIKNKYKYLVCAIAINFLLMSILNINTIGIYLILSLIEAIILINIELKNGTFKENYELLNNTLPNLINSNKDNIKKLKQDLELIKNKIQELNEQQTTISKIIYPENQIEKDNSESIQNDIKIKNYDFFSYLNDINN
ncbi:MAG: hypothetical protein MR765_01760 [Tenericutes bacterium]|nr:hypothetical protein [Mycoplasmatota bacterium]